MQSIHRKMMDAFSIEIKKYIAKERIHGCGEVNKRLQTKK
jgi:hypothetical protein